MNRLSKTESAVLKPLMLYFQKISFQIIYCRNMSDAAIFILDNIYIRHVRFDPTLYRQIVGIRMGTKCAPLVADFLLL